MSSPPVREGPHEKGYMSALAQHVKLYGSVRPQRTKKNSTGLSPRAAGRRNDSQARRLPAGHDDEAARLGACHAGARARVWSALLDDGAAQEVVPHLRAEDVIRALADGTPLHVFPDPHSKQLATIMRPFLTKVVEGGDVYNRGK